MNIATCSLSESFFRCCSKNDCKTMAFVRNAISRRAFAERRTLLVFCHHFFVCWVQENTLLTSIFCLCLGLVLFSLLPCGQSSKCPVLTFEQCDTWVIRSDCQVCLLQGKDVCSTLCFPREKASGPRGIPPTIILICPWRKAVSCLVPHPELEL